MVNRVPIGTSLDSYGRFVVTSNASLRVAVVGAGIGGLTAAIALRANGVDATVYEQASELKALGAGVSIATNGSRILTRLGLGDQLAAIAVRSRTTSFARGPASRSPENPRRCRSGTRRRPGSCTAASSKPPSAPPCPPTPSGWAGASSTRWNAGTRSRCPSPTGLARRPTSSSPPTGFTPACKRWSAKRPNRSARV
ncbi:FAD-dependent monooxygenase [Mycobacterium yunnanensis]|uniref:FAD-dependent monooxygenase n=1 Tax=Mycobacterium yunnanensis TaxID=368477 RepID=A0A9X3BUC0_9MYCO|nr:FAD-dependent monooxygenase [Mycobacterium yunnanensis]